MNDHKYLLNSEYTLISSAEDYAEAAITTNKHLKWIKFVFTDDQPNNNKQRVAQSEFDNVIRSGANMPIKMEKLNPQGTHELSAPIGVITNLQKQENKILGLGALWKEEFAEDISVLEQAYAEGQPLNLSWELFYEDASKDSEGVENLTGTNVRAITFVGSPAYGGRTGVLAMAEEKQPETAQEDIQLGTMNELETQAARVAELEAEVAGLKDQLKTKETEASTVNEELETLRKFKQDREDAEAKAELLKNRRNSLAESGVKLTDEEFTSKAEKIAQMNDDTFSFYAQELAAFAKKGESSAETHSTTTAPDLTSTNTNESALDVLKSAFAPKTGE